MNKKKITIAVVLAIIVAGISGILFYMCYHRWDNATCTTAKTCSICGKTEGEPLGHKWTEATCEEPQICSACGEAKGTALGHKWEEATCEMPKICSVCGKTQGEALGHVLEEYTVVKEATCSEQGEKEAVCSRCKKTIVETIDKVEHTPGEWEVKEDYSISAQAIITPGKQIKKCTVCNKELESKEYTVELSTSQRNAVLKAYQEIQNWHCGRDFLINDVLVGFDGYSIEDATFAVDHIDVDWDYQAILYAKENGVGESENQITEMMQYYGFNQDQIAKALKEIGY